jgi:hypothetical protein
MIKGKIYQIVCRITGEKYVGSTKRTLEERLQEHQYYRNCCSRLIIERGDYYIDLLEDYPCNNVDELRMKEREWFDKGVFINRIRPYITQDELKKSREKANEKAKEMIIIKKYIIYNQK